MGDHEFTVGDLTEMFRRIVLIRRFEERAGDLYRDGEIPGFVHLSVGQEASAVGACWDLTDEDIITSTHRGHGHCLAKGLDAASMMAELLARTSGTNGGRGGSMHIADPRRGVFGANGIVGAGLPIAVGAATARALQQRGAVVVSFFGDGAVAQGAFHESLNSARLFNLPLIFFCENNGWAEFSATSAQHPASLRARAAGYDIRHVEIDGDDIIAVASTMRELVANARAGSGPVLVEALTTRRRGHFEGDQQRYRAESPDASDCLEVAKLHLSSAGVSESAVSRIAEDVEREIEAAINHARSQPEPAAADLGEFVLIRRSKLHEDLDLPLDESSSVDEWKMMDALHDALEHSLADDPRVFIAGIDVSQGVFGITRGLVDRFGTKRVRDTPIAETALMGTAVGAAMAGMRPVVELMYLDFIGVCFDQILNQAAKLHFMTGGLAQLPLVIRTQFGAGRSSGSQHSQSLEALLAHIPGLTVVMPSTPQDAYGLLRSAIEDPNPVVFIEHRLMYGLKGPRVAPSHRTPIGRAAIRRCGRDVTLVSVSRMAQRCLEAADSLADDGIDVEVIDLRTVSPLDWETVANSLKKTSRLVIAHEAVETYGIGAELAARAADEEFWRLDAPIKRIAAAFTPAPYAPSLEQAWLPDIEQIITEVRSVVDV